MLDLLYFRNYYKYYLYIVGLSSKELLLLQNQFDIKQMELLLQNQFDIKQMKLLLNNDNKKVLFNNCKSLALKEEMNLLLEKCAIIENNGC